MLVEARDPGNAGTVVRTADAAGADCVIFAGDSVDPWSGKCVRASAGSLLHLPIVDAVSLEETIAALQESGCTDRGRRCPRRAHDLHDPEAVRALAGDHAWVFGNEARGLSRLLVRSADISAAGAGVRSSGIAEPRGSCGRVPLRVRARGKVEGHGRPPPLTAGGGAEEVRG